MPMNTTNQQITLPVGTDVADGPQAFLDQTADFEGRLVQRYTTAGDRTARNPAPVLNELSILDSSTWYDRWTGSKWIPVTPIQVRKAATQTVNNSTTLVNDADLAINFPAVSAAYTIEAFIGYVSTTVADIKFAFAASAAISGFNFFPMGLASGAAGTTGDFQAAMTGALGTTITIGGAGSNTGCMLYGRMQTTGAAGTLQLQWAQNALEATNTQVFLGSWLRITAII